MVIVLDRTPAHLDEYVRRAWEKDTRTRFVVVEGEPGWRSPVKAWNAGFEALDGDALYCISSETVQASGNLRKARHLLTQEPRTLVFGKAECSCGPNGHEVDWSGTAPGNLLCDAAHPRPLGFIWFGPLAPVKSQGGFDTGFAEGFWYDEHDFFLRLWRQGLDFAYDDSVSGVHLHHERPDLTQEGIKRNAAYMAGKYGSLDPLRNVLYGLEARPGRTVWRHI